MSHHYQSRLAARRDSLDNARRLDGRLANARLAVFGVVLVVAWLGLVSQWFSPVWMAAPLALFVFLVIRHHRASEARDRAERAVAFYERALALEAWRARYAARLAGWANVLGEFEALASLETYAYERPDDHFPEFADESPMFRGRGLSRSTRSSRARCAKACSRRATRWR